MNPLKLVKMANEIASYFEAEGERSVVIDGIAGHLRRFWDPRMRREILAWLDEQGGAGLKPIVAESLRVHRAKLQPPEPVT